MDYDPIYPGDIMPMSNKEATSIIILMLGFIALAVLFAVGLLFLEKLTPRKAPDSIEQSNKQEVYYGQVLRK